MGGGRGAQLGPAGLRPKYSGLAALLFHGDEGGRGGGRGFGAKLLTGS